MEAETRYGPVFVVFEFVFIVVGVDDNNNDQDDDGYDDDNMKHLD